MINAMGSTPGFISPYHGLLRHFQSRLIVSDMVDQVNTIVELHSGYNNKRKGLNNSDSERLSPKFIQELKIQDISSDPMSFLYQCTDEEQINNALIYLYKLQQIQKAESVDYWRQA